MPRRGEPHPRSQNITLRPPPGSGLERYLAFAEELDRDAPPLWQHSDPIVREIGLRELFREEPRICSLPTELYRDEMLVPAMRARGIPGTMCRCWPRKPGALRNGAPFKGWVLPSGLDRIHRKLAGVDDGDRQMVAILTAVLTDGLSVVEAACQEALREGVYSADVVLNILPFAVLSNRLCLLEPRAGSARQREPTAAAITVITPPPAVHHADAWRSLSRLRPTRSGSGTNRKPIAPATTG